MSTRRFEYRAAPDRRSSFLGVKIGPTASADFSRQSGHCNVIADIPTPEEFERTGISLLNLAWDVVSALFVHAENSELKKWDDDGTVTDEFWAAAQQPLGNAQALLHQGVEFLLKARIAEVSPFLLLDRAVRDWPKDSGTRNVKFAEFRTIDAQDLVRLFNTVRDSRLDEGFARRIEEQRKSRNTFIHSIGKSASHSPGGLWLAILDISHHLIGKHRWLGLRRQYLETSPASVAFSTDAVPVELAWEVRQLLEFLKPAPQEAYLGTSPKARFYICPTCATDCRDADFRPQTAQLRPNESSAKAVYCFVCGETHKVARKACVNTECKGNVIYKEERLCLVCYEGQ